MFGCFSMTHILISLASLCSSRDCQSHTNNINIVAHFRKFRVILQMNPQPFYGYQCPVGQTTLKDVAMPAMSLRDSVYVHYRACDIELQDVEQNLLQRLAQLVSPAVDRHLNLLFIFIFHAHEEIRETTCGKTTEPMLVYCYDF